MRAMIVKGLAVQTLGLTMLVGTSAISLPAAALEPQTVTDGLTACINYCGKHNPAFSLALKSRHLAHEDFAGHSQPASGNLDPPLLGPLSLQMGEGAKRF